MLDTSLPGGLGGQFGVVDPGNAAGFGFNYFVTFCVEVTESITSNGKFYVTAIANQNSTGKLLGNQAKYLYAQFRNGTLPNFSYASDTDANSLQYGIWLGMGYTHGEIQSAIGSSTANSYQSSWNNRSANWLSAFDNDSFVDPGVRVMQLGDTKGGPGNRQDQLVIIPEASTIAVWSMLSLVGLAAYRWRTNSNA